MKNSVLLLIGAILLFVGLVKPDLSNVYTPGSSVAVVEGCVTDAPADDNLLAKSKVIVDILKSSDDSTKKGDCLKLTSLYCDLATLIELDGEDKVITDTLTIREANSLSGKMLRLNIKDKYPNLAEAAKDVIVAGIGDQDVALTPELRKKAAESFRALSWAFYQGSK
jgi:hypothetical protein